MSGKYGMRLGLLLPLALGFCLPAKADPFDDWQKAEAQAETAWRRLPMSTRNATFISEKPTGYGIYKARETNVFKPTDELLTYVEPLGYDWKPLPDGLVQMGFDSDFTVTDRQGKVIAKQSDFAHSTVLNHHRAREFYIEFTLSLSGMPEGAYTLTYTIRDTASDKSTRFDQPFEVRK